MERSLFQREPVIEIGQARFEDQLDNNYEQLWMEIQSNLETLTDFQALISACKTIWISEEYPLAIRDRAMLCLVGDFEGRANPLDLSLADNKGEQTLFDDWLVAAIRHTHKIKKPVICLSYTRKVAKYCSKKGLIHKREINEILETVSILEDARVNEWFHRRDVVGDQDW